MANFIDHLTAPLPHLDVRREEVVQRGQCHPVVNRAHWRQRVDGTCRAVDLPAAGHTGASA